MKRAFIALGLLVLLAAPAGAGSIGLHGSWWDADGADDDVGFGGRLKVDLGDAVDFELRGTWFSEQEVLIAPEVVPFSAYILDLGITYGFGGAGRRMTPYIGAGGSYFFLDTDNDLQGRLEDEFGWYGVIGIDAPIGTNWVLYLEGMWRDSKATLKGSDLGFSPTVGGQGFSLAGPTVNVGVAFGW